MPERLSERSRASLLACLLAAAAVPAVAAVAAPSLQPTRAGLLRQSLGASEAGMTYLENDGQVHDFVRQGLLVTMRGNDDYYIHPDVRHTAARPEVKAFVERLAKQYRDACDEKLVVTSLVRPRNRQPWNSDPLSVHPTGMAVDLRISASSACRRWLEKTLLELEGEGLVEAARERVVPHYHVVVFPTYAQHLERNGIELPAASGVVLAGLPVAMIPLAAALPAPAMPIAAPAVARSGSTPAAARAASPRRTTTTTAKHTSTRRPSTTSRRPSVQRYKVRRGDNLWSIARRHGISVQAIRRANKVASTQLRPGQVLAIPARAR